MKEEHCMPIVVDENMIPDIRYVIFCKCTSAWEIPEQIRIRNAADMLASGEYKVSDIAEACGFTDVSHFYKQFKLIKGFPPSHSLPKKF